MFSYSVLGIRQGLLAMDQAARRIADFESSDTARDQVDLMIAERTVQANLQALRCQRDASRSILDILA